MSHNYFGEASKACTSCAIKTIKRVNTHEKPNFPDTYNEDVQLNCFIQLANHIAASN